MTRSGGAAPAEGSRSGAGREVGRQTVSRATWLAAAALLVLYTLTRAHIHTWDALAYAARAAADPLLADRYFSLRLFHPHHLLYVPLAILARKVFAVLGMARDPLLPLQLMSAIFGAAAALLAGALARRLGASERRALLVILATGISNAVWRFSTEALVMVPSLFFLVLSAWAAAGARTRRAWLGSGVALAGAVLLHQSAAAFALAASVTLFIVARGERRGTADPLAFTLGWMLPTAAAYLAVGAVETGGLSPGALAAWMFTAAARGTSVHMALPEVLKEGADGLAESWVTLTPLRALKSTGGGDPGVWPGALVSFAGVVAMSIAGIATLARVVRGAGTRDVVSAMIVAGSVLTGALITWFQPWNHAYWVYFPALGLALAGAHLPPLRAPARRVMQVVLALVATANLGVRVLPAMDPSRAPYADLLEFARQHLRPGDLLVCEGVDSAIGEGIIALPFFARVEVAIAPRPGHADEEARFRRLVDAGLAAAARGGTVLALEEALEAVRSRYPAIGARRVGTLRGATVYALGVAAAAETTAAPRPTAAPHRAARRGSRRASPIPASR